MLDRTTEAAVQVLRAHARRLLRHRRAGDRLLRPLPALLRPRTRRVPPQARPARDGDRRARRRVRHARVHDRVPRARGLRRRARGLHPRRAHRPHERDVRVRRVSRARRRCSWSRRRRRSCSSTSTSARPCEIPQHFRDTIRAFEGDDVVALVGRARGRRAHPQPRRRARRRLQQVVDDAHAGTVRLGSASRVRRGETTRARRRARPSGLRAARHPQASVVTDRRSVAELGRRDNAGHRARLERRVDPRSLERRPSSSDSGSGDVRAQLGVTRYASNTASMLRSAVSSPRRSFTSPTSAVYQFFAS